MDDDIPFYPVPKQTKETMKPNTDNDFSRDTTALAQQWGVTIKAIYHRNRCAANRFADSNEITSLVLFGGGRKVFVPYHDRAVKFVELRCAA